MVNGDIDLLRQIAECRSLLNALWKLCIHDDRRHIIQHIQFPVNIRAQNHAALSVKFHRKPYVLRVCQFIFSRILIVPPVSHIDELSIFRINGDDVGGLGSKGQRIRVLADGSICHTWVTDDLPITHDTVFRNREAGLVSPPAGAAGGHEVIFPIVFEHRRRFPLLSGKRLAS